MPLVSVIMPVFNAAPYLPAALESIRGQSLQDIELLCVDDGSTDACPDILARFQAEDPRIRVIRQANGGPGAARNAGLSVARGRYVYCFDSDDLLAPEALAQAVAEADEHQLDALWFGASSFGDAEMRAQRPQMFTYFDGEHGPTETMTGEGFLARKVAQGQYRCSPCIYLVRRELLETAAIRYPEAGLHEDNLFTFEVCLAAQRVRELPHKWFRRRVRPGSIMTSRSTLSNYLGCLVGYEGMLSRFLRRPPSPEAVDAVHELLELMKSQALLHLKDPGVRSAAQKPGALGTGVMRDYLHVSFCRQLDHELATCTEVLSGLAGVLRLLPSGSVPTSVTWPAVGQVDDLWIERDVVMLRGWALAWNQQAVSALLVSDGVTALTVPLVNAVARPDVLDHYPDGDLGCGFVASLDVAALSLERPWSVRGIPACGGHTSPLAMGATEVPNRMTGHVDQVRVRDGRYQAEGWVLLDRCQPAERLWLRSGSLVVEAHMLQRVERPDVQACHPLAALDCGFVAVFDLAAPPDSAMVLHAAQPRAAEASAEGAQPMGPVCSAAPGSSQNLQGDRQPTAHGA